MEAKFMKHSIGVVTLSGLFNYGNRLQAYASTAIYRKLGAKNEQIRKSA
jgi:hypothetical protein